MVPLYINQCKCFYLIHYKGICRFVNRKGHTIKENHLEVDATAICSKTRPWAILAAGRSHSGADGYCPAAWGVFQTAGHGGVRPERAGGGLCLRHPHRGVRRGVRPRRLSAGQAEGLAVCGSVGDSTAVRRILWAAAMLPAGQCRQLLFWGVQHPGRAGHGLSLPVHPVLRPEVVCRGARALPPASSAGAVGLSGAFLTVFVRTALQGLWDRCRASEGAFWALGAADAARLPCGQPALLHGPAAGEAEAQQAGKGRHATSLDLSPWQMLRTQQYWLCAGAVCFSTPAVLLFSPIILKLGMERGLDESAALWSVVLGSVGSAAGRLLMPLLSDKIGRQAHRPACCSAVSLGLSAVILRLRSGWCGGRPAMRGSPSATPALAAVLPALSTDLFGLPHAGVNYGFLALGQSVGSLSFPFIGQSLGASEAGAALSSPSRGAAAGFACHLGAVICRCSQRAAGRTPKLRNSSL